MSATATGTATPPLVEVACYFCGGSSSRPFATENGFVLVRCCGCGLLYVALRPREQDIAESARQGARPFRVKQLWMNYSVSRRLKTDMWIRAARD